MSDISIIMPIYNAEKFLKKSISSILNQTYKDFELILVNDSSTDNSLAICENYTKKDKRLRIINQKNSGVVLARRNGIKISIGKYIIFVDADDWLELAFVEKLYREIKRTQSDICVCKKYKTLNKFTFIKKDMNDTFDRFYSQKTEYNKDEIKNNIVKSFLFSGCFTCEVTSKIYKRSLFENSGKYAKYIKFYGEDLYLNFELFLKANKVSLLDEVLYFYRKGGGTSNYMKDYFSDIINGLYIKQNIVHEYYEELKDEILITMYMNFLELYKSCIFNLLYSGFDEVSIKRVITEQLENKMLKDVIKFMKNQDFDVEFVQALYRKDVECLYKIAKRNSMKRFCRDKIMEII